MEDEDHLKLIRLGLAKPSNLPQAMLRHLHAHLGDALFDIAKGLNCIRNDNNGEERHE